MAQLPARALLPADGFEELIVIHPVLLELVAQDSNPARTHKGQLENLLLRVGDSPCWELTPPSSHRIVTVRLSVIPMVPRLVIRPKCQSKSAPACAARLASSSSEPALVIRPVVLSEGLSSVIRLCSHCFCAGFSRVHTLSA